MFGFLIAVAAGFLTPFAEAPLARPLARLLERHMTLEPGEVRVISFMVILLVAAILCAIFNSGSVFGIVLGAILGYFGLRIIAAVKDMMAARSKD